MAVIRSPYAKHYPGQHDQSDHGNWARGSVKTLYRGEGSHDRPSYYTTQSGQTGGWWTDDIESARRYAGPEGKVYEIEVDESEAETRGLPSYYFIADPEVRARRRLVKHLGPGNHPGTGTPQAVHGGRSHTVETEVKTGEFRREGNRWEPVMATKPFPYKVVRGYSGTGVHSSSEHALPAIVQSGGLDPLESSGGYFGRGIYTSFGPSGQHLQEAVLGGVKYHIEFDLDKVIYMESDDWGRFDHNILNSVIRDALIREHPDPAHVEEILKDVRLGLASSTYPLLLEAGFDGIVWSRGPDWDYGNEWGSQVVLMDKSKFRVTDIENLPETVRLPPSSDPRRMLTEEWKELTEEKVRQALIKRLGDTLVVMWADFAAWLDGDEVAKHMGPGPHPSGTSQLVHGGSSTKVIDRKGKTYRLYDPAPASERDVKPQAIFDVTVTLPTGERYSTEVTSAQASKAPDGSNVMIYLHGEIYQETEEGNRRAGHFKRILDPNNGDLYNAEFYLNDEDQGKGLGLTLLAHWEDELAAAGYRTMRVSTDEVGRYAWAMAGYNWQDLDEASQIMEDLSIRVSDYERGTDVDGMLHLFPQEAWQDAVTLVRKWETNGEIPAPYQLAVMGLSDDYRYLDQHLGKAFMLSSWGWDGVKELRVRKNLDRLQVLWREWVDKDPAAVENDDPAWLAAVAEILVPTYSPYAKHYGPGNHPSGSPQTAHAGGQHPSAPDWRYIVEEEDGSYYMPPLPKPDLKAKAAFEKLTELNDYHRSLQKRYQALVEEQVDQIVREQWERTHKTASGVPTMPYEEYREYIKTQYGLPYKRAQQVVITKADHPGRKLTTEMDYLYRDMVNHAHEAIPYLVEEGLQLDAEIMEAFRGGAGTDSSKPSPAELRIMSGDDLIKIAPEDEELQALYKKWDAAKKNASHKYLVAKQLRDRRLSGESKPAGPDLGWQVKMTPEESGIIHGDQPIKSIRWVAVPEGYLTTDANDNWRFARNKSSLDPEFKPVAVYVPTAEKEVKDWSRRLRDEQGNILRDEAGMPVYGTRVIRTEDEAWIKDYEAKHGVQLVPDYTYRNVIDSEASSAYRSAESYTNKALSLKNDMAARLMTVNGQRGDVVRQLLEKHRPTGGQFTYTHKRATKSTKAIDHQSRFLPTQWIEDSNAAGPLTLQTSQARAHYVHEDGKLRVGGKYLGGDILHELGHRIEHTNLAIKAVEKAFYDQRTMIKGTNERQSSQSIRGLRGEYAVKDDFDHIYMGKHYRPYGPKPSYPHYDNGEAFELLSMALPIIYEHREGYGLDREMRGLFLGVLKNL